jgi:hypothetical protein
MERIRRTSHLDEGTIVGAGSVAGLLAVQLLKVTGEL